MSFISFLVDQVFKKIRRKREPVKIPCKSCIYKESEKPENFNNLNDSIAIDISSKGLGMIQAPPFDEEFQKKIKSTKYKIYIEIFSEETQTLVKLNGEIRWIRNVIDVKKPYSEFGVLLESVNDDSKLEIFDTLFTTNQR
ncbi:MAG: hypothetical protein ACD_79C00295G0002 [uncultured bacterium]|nr:MAG: hypothetical protein ACD_79C00295G0002 [uncultured bacterium]